MLGRNRIVVVTGLILAIGCGGRSQPSSPDSDVTVSSAVTARATTPIVAVHVSEYTAQVWKYTNWKSFHPAAFLEESLQSDGIPFVEVSDAAIAAGTLMDGSLPRYPILFSLAAEAISDAEVSQIRTYVNAGGYAYVGSSAWTRREDGSMRRNPTTGVPEFALGTEMGLFPRGWMRTSMVQKTSNPTDAAMVNQLPTGTSVDWQLVKRYANLDLRSPHWIWKALRGVAPEVLLIPAGNATFGFQPSFGNPPAISNPTTATFRFGDVNGDGRTDLVYRQGSTVYVRLSNLSGTGELTSDFTTNGLALQPSVVWSTWDTGYSFDIADVNGDGKADLVGRSGSTVQAGLSNGSAFTTSTQWTTWNPSYDMQFADVDGDGDADIIGRLIGGSDVQVGRSNGAAGGFASSTTWTTWNPGYSMTFADVDGDGDADIIGRQNGGSDVQVGRSNGKGGGTGFAVSTQWTTWDPAYTMMFAQVDVDKAADIVGRSAATGDVRVALAGTNSFSAPQSWTTWGAGFTMDLADINGDGAADIVGCNQSNASYPLGDVEVGLSTRSTDGAVAELSVKRYGAGKFFYNAEIVPTAGYGGFAEDNAEYKTVRYSIVQAFNTSAAMPLVTLAPWPFPQRAALIYRHDHYLAADVHGVEQQLAGASSSNKFGEYYLMPEKAGEVGPCSQVNDYTAQVNSTLQTGAMIGAHLKFHEWLDDFSYADALAKIQSTVTDIQAGTANRMSPIYVAPTYAAVNRTSMMAIRDAGFLTTGEQGAGPLPHFALDLETKGAYIGALLELPTSEWPGYDDMERMTVAPDSITKAAALAYEMGGLVNVYDHAGADPYDSGCTTTRTQLANTYLSYAVNLPGIWKTNSLDIRRWWLQRDAHAFSASFSNLAGSPSTINVTLQAHPPRASTDYPVDNLALRIFLDADSANKANAWVVVTLDGVAQPGASCANNPRTLCTTDPAGNNQMYVKIGGASQVGIQMGQFIIP